MVKNLPASAGDVRDTDSIPGLGRSPGEGKGYPLQDSGLESSVDCRVYGVTKSRTRLSDLHFTHCLFKLWPFRLVRNRKGQRKSQGLPFATGLGESTSSSPADRKRKEVPLPGQR